MTLARRSTAETGARNPSRALIAMLGLIGCVGYLQMINSGAAPLYAKEFALGEAALSRAFAWISLGALGVIALSRWMDQVGRRRVALIGVAGIAASSLVSSFAPTMQWLVAAQIGVRVFQGALIGASNVMISEELPAAVRARGQAASGAVHHLGSGLALIVCAGVAGLPGTWRWAWVLPALPLLALPWVARVLRETQPFVAAAARGETAQARVVELFRGAYARRTVCVLCTYLFTNITSTGAMTWIVFHAVATLEIQPVVATAAVIGGGAVGMLGFPLSAHLCDRIGRRPTALMFGIAFSLSSVGYYSVSRELTVSPAPVLFALFGVACVGFAAYSVATRTAATELFPTRLRGTLQGFIGAVASTGTLVSAAGIAVLTEVLGSLALAVSIASLATIPGVLLFYLAVPETAGWELDQDEP